ncbi:MAG: carboxylate-amine ligase [Planctomycetota bacterium]
MKPFVKNEYPTIGVEQEFHLINKESGDLVGCVDEVIEQVDEALKESIDHELYLAVLEHKSAVCRTVDELVREVIEKRRYFSKICEGMGIKLAAAGSHPFADWRKVPGVPSEHYKWVRRECNYLARRLVSFGLHVHVGMRSIESAMYAMYEMRRWTFPLLAMSANSPYYEGELTGLASTRYHLFGSMPRTHFPPYFENFSELESYYEKLAATGDVTMPGDLWWILRPQPPLGTLEFRIFDLPTEVRRLGACAAISQCAAAFYQDRFFEGEKPSKLNDGYLEQNYWKGMRHGLDGDIIEPEMGEVISIRKQLNRLFDMLETKAKELDCTQYLEIARGILETGNEAAWQVERSKILEGDLRALELEIAQRTLPSEENEN